jgi:hypothetical protein
MDAKLVCEVDVEGLKRAVTVAVDMRVRVARGAEGVPAVCRPL